jgi:putative membrane protein
MNKLKINKYEVATFIALLFHFSGFIGMFTSKQSWFIANTPLNLVLMFILIIWTHSGKNASFFLFVLIAFVIGMVTEMIGANTSLLFGKYEYGKVLGAGINNVPWLIGLNWVTIIYCCGIAISHVQSWFFSRSPASQTLLSPQVQLVSFIADGAMLATAFDFVIEPVAVKLGYWTWLGDSTIPFTNYLCWFLISALLMAAFRLLRFPKRNQFAVHLLIIELLFFAALRTFL